MEHLVSTTGINTTIASIVFLFASANLNLLLSWPLLLRRHIFNRKRRPQQLSNSSKPHANLTGRHENPGLSKLDSGKAGGSTVKVRKSSKDDGVKKTPEKGADHKPLLSKKVSRKPVRDEKRNGVSHCISFRERGTPIGAVDLSEK